MTPHPAPCIEILLRVDGGPSIEPASDGSYRCQGPVKLDSENSGPSAIRFYPPPSGLRANISPEAIVPMFTESLYERMRSAGAEVDQGLSFVCQDIMAAENTALDFLSLAFGDQTRIELWQISLNGKASLVRCGSLVDDPKPNEIGAIFRFGFTSNISVEVGNSATGFQEHPDIESGRIQYISTALSKAEFSEIDHSLPPFVGPLPGARLNAIAILLSERFRKSLGFLPAGDGILLHAWRESKKTSLGSMGDSIPIFEIDIATASRLPSQHEIADAISRALDGRGIVESAHQKEDAISKVAGQFHSREITRRISVRNSKKIQKDPPGVRKNGPSF